MENILKYLMLMFAATFSLSLTSCGDDDPNGTEFVINLTNTKLEIDSWAGKACEIYTDATPFDVLEFYSNGIVIERNNKTNSNLTGTYTISGDIISFNGLSNWSTIWGNNFKISPYSSWDGKEMVCFSTTETTNFIGSSFYCHIHYNNSENGGSENGGSNNENNDNNGGGTNGGGSSDHHYPCKSCDETGNCWNCFGSGTDPITQKKCNTCHGSGKCQTCHGKGYINV